MKKIAVVTDSNSGITQKQAAELSIYVLPMPVIIDGETFYEDINLSQAEFYKRLAAGAVVTTSQPAIGAVTEIWDDVLKTHDEIVHIPMSSGLSNSYETADMISQDYGGRVQVVNNQRISVTQRQSALDALELARSGMGSPEIKSHLEKVKFETGIYIMVDTLKYLVRGGRVTPAGAALGKILRIKPVLQIQGEKLDAFAKVMGVRQARKVIIKAVKDDFKKRFSGFDSHEKMNLHMAYTFDREAAMDFQTEVQEEFHGFNMILDPLSLSVACHIGPGALALAYSKKI